MFSSFVLGELKKDGIVIRRDPDRWIISSD